MLSLNTIIHIHVKITFISYSMKYDIVMRCSSNHFGKCHQNLLSLKSNFTFLGLMSQVKYGLPLSDSRKNTRALNLGDY